MRVLDLFCGAGGAAMGLHRAWPSAEIVGVDIMWQPQYPFSFRLAHALSYLCEMARCFDFIWASPPCQKFTALRTMKNAKEHPDLLTPTRQILLETSVPWVIENVPGAPLGKGSVMLCGTMFGLGVKEANAELRRHRWFEANFPILTPTCNHQAGKVCGVYGGRGRDRRRVIPVYSHGRGGPNARIADRRRTVTVVSKQGGYPPTVSCYGHADGRSRRDGTQMFNTQQQKEAMGIDWMKDAELSQAVPPAYSEFIARQVPLR